MYCKFQPRCDITYLDCFLNFRANQPDHCQARCCSVKDNNHMTPILSCTTCSMHGMCVTVPTTAGKCRTVLLGRLQWWISHQYSLVDWNIITCRTTSWLGNVFFMHYNNTSLRLMVTHSLLTSTCFTKNVSLIKCLLWFQITKYNLSIYVLWVETLYISLNLFLPVS